MHLNSSIQWGVLCFSIGYLVAMMNMDVFKAYQIVMITAISVPIGNINICITPFLALPIGLNIHSLKI